MRKSAARTLCLECGTLPISPRFRRWSSRRRAPRGISFRNKGNRNRDNVRKRQVLRVDRPFRSCRIPAEQLGADRGSIARRSCHHLEYCEEEAIARVEGGSRGDEQVQDPDNCGARRPEQGLEANEPQHEVGYFPCERSGFHDEKRRDRPLNGGLVSRAGQ